MRALFAPAPFAALAAALAAATLAPLGASAQDGLTDGQKDDVRTVVREYLLEHPEVIEEAIFELRARRELEREQRDRAVIAALAPELLSDPRDFSTGPVDAPVQIVEFFDYNCPYCRLSASWVQETLERYPDQIHFVFKETPIFGDTRESSDLAARVAVAAAAHGKYLDFHFQLMEADGTVPVAQVRHVAEAVGLNWNRIQSAIESPETTEQLEQGLDLLAQVGATGTPAFVINGELVQGANTERLDQLIQIALGVED